MTKHLWHFVKSENGATAIEYGLIGGLVFLVIVSAVTALGNTVQTMFNSVAAAF